MLRHVGSVIPGPFHVASGAGAPVLEAIDWTTTVPTASDPNGYATATVDETGLVSFSTLAPLNGVTNTAFVGATTTRPSAVDLAMNLLDFDPATEDLAIQVVPVTIPLGNLRLGLIAGVLEGTGIVIPGAGWYEASVGSHTIIGVTSGIAASASTGATAPASITGCAFAHITPGFTNAMQWTNFIKYRAGTKEGSAGQPPGSNGRSSNAAALSLRVALLHASGGAALPDDTVISARIKYARIPRVT